MSFATIFKMFMFTNDNVICSQIIQYNIVQIIYQQESFLVGCQPPSCRLCMLHNGHEQV